MKNPAARSKIIETGFENTSPTEPAMPKTPTDKQLSLLDPAFAKPDSKADVSPLGKAKRVTARNAKPGSKNDRQTKPVTARQPVLPGIAVRGRPRLRVKRSASERAAESRREREAAGNRRVELMLTPEVLAGLDALVRESASTRAEVIARLIRASLCRRRARIRNKDE